MDFSLLRAWRFGEVGEVAVVGGSVVEMCVGVVWVVLVAVAVAGAGVVASVAFWNVAVFVPEALSRGGGGGAGSAGLRLGRALCCVFFLFTRTRRCTLTLTRFVDRFIEASKAQSPNYMETMSGREPSFYPKIAKGSI